MFGENDDDEHNLKLCKLIPVSYVTISHVTRTDLSQSIIISFRCLIVISLIDFKFHEDQHYTCLYQHCAS